MVDQYGYFILQIWNIKPFASSLSQSRSYEKCLIYRKYQMEAHDRSIDNNNFWSSKRKLPPILWMEMDICVDDNNIGYVFSFLSLLTSRRVFDTIKIGLLLVGHTHEDIDGNFGSLSLN